MEISIETNGKVKGVWIKEYPGGMICYCSGGSQTRKDGTVRETGIDVGVRLTDSEGRRILKIYLNREP